MNFKNVFIFSVLNILLDVIFGVLWFWVIIVISLSNYWIRVESNYVCMQYTENFLEMTFSSIIFIIIPWIILKSFLLRKFNILKQKRMIFYLSVLYATIGILWNFIWEFLYYYFNCIPEYWSEGLWYNFSWERDSIFIKLLSGSTLMLICLSVFSLIASVFYSWFRTYSWKK